MLKLVLEKTRIRQREIAQCLGITDGAVSSKMSGRRPWSLEQARLVTAFLNEETGHTYSVEQLFFPEAGAA